MDRERHTIDGEWGFLNALYYADWSIGQFMEKVRQYPWFHNTVFMFTADHTIQAFAQMRDEERYRIPFLIYDARTEKSDTTPFYASHIDILPTVFELAGVRESVATVGRSLINPTIHERFALLAGRGELPSIVNQNAYLRLLSAETVDMQVRSESCDQLCADRLRRFLPAYVDTMLRMIYLKRF